jgi:hypothetical protein
MRRIPRPCIRSSHPPTSRPTLRSYSGAARFVSPIRVLRVRATRRSVADALAHRFAANWQGRSFNSCLYIFLLCVFLPSELYSTSLDCFYISFFFSFLPGLLLLVVQLLTPYFDFVDDPVHHALFFFWFFFLPRILQQFFFYPIQWSSPSSFYCCNYSHFPL